MAKKPKSKKDDEPSKKDAFAHTYRTPKDARAVDSTSLLSDPTFDPNEAPKKKRKRKTVEGRVVIIDGHRFIELFSPDAPEEEKWSTQPSFEMQQQRFPSTVRMSDFKTDVFDMSLPEDRVKYAALWSDFVERRRWPFKDFFQTADTGKTNFRMCVTHGVRMYLRVMRAD